MKYLSTIVKLALALIALLSLVGCDGPGGG